MKYPPYSWLRLSDEIRQSPSRIWFALNKLPERRGLCSVKVHIGGTNSSISDPYDAIADPNLILPRQQKVLERFLKIAKPTKVKNEFTLDHAALSTLIPFCAAIPFEVAGEGVISFAKLNARIKASLKKNKGKDPKISFSLTAGSTEKVKNPRFFGDVNAYVIDEELKLYLIVPNLTEEEAQAILSSPELPLVGLCQNESRQMFYALSRMGIDFSCLHDLAVEPEHSQIVLRLLLNIDDLTKRMCARVHLVTQISHGDFSDEVEIKSTGSIPSLHICATPQMDEEKYAENVEAPTLLRRPYQLEAEARNFFYHLGASPARLHDGFELSGESAFALLKSVSHKGSLPEFIKLDENARPEIVELPTMLTLLIRAANDNPTRVEVALSLSKEFDATEAKFEQLNKAKENILVLDEDTLVILNDEIFATLKYFSETLGLEEPNQYKQKPVAQIALILNAFHNRILISAEPKLAHYLERFSLNINDDDRTLPEGLQTTLRPYQHDAVAWLSSLHRAGLGGLLGDEMGLGKTLMILTHIARLKEAGITDKPALVVCPTSVIDVWKEEAATHIPSLHVTKWHGPTRDLVQDKILDSDIVITSYAILRRDIASRLKDIEFSTLILDEAQYVRNQQTDSFKSAKAVKCTQRIALTGTPIENHVGDLFNILDCVEDGILGSRSAFEKQFGNPIEAGEQESAANLKTLLAPIVTRRKKSEVESELPPKIESIVHCKLSPTQRQLYKKYVNQLSGSLMSGSLIADGTSSQQTHFMLLSALTRLRQICCHPSLVLGHEASEQESGKLVAIKQIISECLEMGRKIIIYSQFLKMQELIVSIVQALDEKGALWLHGSSQNRDEIVKSFQRPDGPRVIVVSLKAGGTGITLTQADTVIFADPWWNPAVEDQAVDRAHRIGQKKTVHVIRVIAEDSIECEVVALAHKKRLAANSVLQGGFKTTANLTKDEVKGLLLREVERIKPGGPSTENDDFGDEDLGL